MKGKRNVTVSILCAAGILALILDSRTAIASGIEGVELCIYTVLPSLFPFFLFSGLLVSSLQGIRLPLPRSLRLKLGIPDGGEGLLLTGLLGGYPVGALSISQLYTKGVIPAKIARRMLGFCVNAGPAFLFGICGMLFSRPWIPWILWFIHIVAALLTAWILPGKENVSIGRIDRQITVADALRRAVINIALVCGWVILAKVLIGFLDRWLLWIFPRDLRILLIGMIELSNGCTELSKVVSEPLRFILCSGMLAMGGASVYLQVVSATGTLGTGMYIHGKLLQTGISTALAFIGQYFLFSQPLSYGSIAVPALLLGIIITGLIPYSVFYKNKSSILLNNHV